MSITESIQAIVQFLILLFSKRKTIIHTAGFWRQRAVELLEENRILKQQLQDEKQSRMIADKVFSDARSKMDDLKYQLELYEDSLEEQKQELERREALLCSCKRIPTSIPSFEFMPYEENSDSNWEDDVPMSNLSSSQIFDKKRLIASISYSFQKQTRRRSILRWMTCV
jgi:chromosome segregation ATPase